MRDRELLSDLARLAYQTIQQLLWDFNVGGVA
jgi:hypothetical protein